MAVIGWASLLGLVFGQCFGLRVCQRDCRTRLLLPSFGFAAYSLVMLVWSDEPWLLHVWLAALFAACGLRLLWVFHKRDHACHRDGKMPSNYTMRTGDASRPAADRDRRWADDASP